MKFYVTTPIYYVNGAPHIGHAYTTVAADSMARWNRLRGNSTFFLTGTDEHGSKITQAAREAGKETAAFVDEVALRFKDLREPLDLSWDEFIRTSDKQKHWPGAEALWQKIEQVGDIYEKEYEGLYCVGCEAFVTERDLVDGLCPHHGKPPELLKEKNLFFKLSKYGDQIKQAIESGEMVIEPEGRRNEVLSLISEGLEDISFSRSRDKLEWGIPVPGHPDQTMYVWCDALSNYISAIGYGRDENRFKEWWPADVHVIGKDILRFHAAIWPGMLLSAGLELPKRIFVHGFITSEGEKMSKTLGNVIDPVELSSKYGSDALRYYLLRDIPSSEDGDFSITRFEERYNADLANGIGNYASRVSTLAESVESFEGLEASSEIKRKIEEAIQSAAGAAERFRLHEAVAIVWELISFGDRYVNDHKPWESKDPQVIFNALYLLATLADLVSPVIPKAGKAIKSSIEIEGGIIKGVKKIENLFPRLNK